MSTEQFVEKLNISPFSVLQSGQGEVRSAETVTSSGN